MRRIILGFLTSLLIASALPSRATELELMAIVPDHVGWTLQKSPVLYFYISQATSLPIQFILLDGRTLSPLLEVALPSLTRPGLGPIRLKDYSIGLEEDVQYRWYVSVVCNPDSHSTDMVAGGVIERIDPHLIDYYGHVCDKESVLLASKAGLWYDVFACVTDLIEANPEDRSLRDLRDKFLGIRRGIILPDTNMG